jgi:hypothetical protein
MAMTRKEFLKSAGAATLALMLPDSSRAWALDTSGTPSIDARNLPSADEMWKWLEQLAAWCPAFTGSANHTNFVNFLDGRLRSAGLTPQRKTFKLPYWELKNYSLNVGTEAIPLTSYRPYSGTTAGAGVTAPLYDAGVGNKLDLSGARGKIVVFEMTPAAAAAGGDRAGGLIGTYPANRTVPPSMGNALRGLRSETNDMKAFEEAGAVGVVHIWTSVSDGNAKDQAAPAFSVPSKTPTVLVGYQTGQHLKKLAASGAAATLTMVAVTHPDTPSDNLWAILPGQSDENIIINTHTDGCNANEENGALGIVALAQYFAKVPAPERQRNLIFLMTSGHFGHGYFRGTQDWIQTNQDAMKKTVACVTIEHLGATAWIDDAIANVYRATGEYEWGPAYTPLRAEGELWLKAVQGTTASNTYAQQADQYAGEGQAFHRAGIPCISYIPTPQYLFATPDKGGVIEKLDKQRFYGEVVTFARCIAALDKISVAQIKG